MKESNRFDDQGFEFYFFYFMEIQKLVLIFCFLLFMEFGVSNFEFVFFDYLVFLYNLLEMLYMFFFSFLEDFCIFLLQLFFVIYEFGEKEVGQSMGYRKREIFVVWLLVWGIYYREYIQEKVVLVFVDRKVVGKGIFFFYLRVYCEVR